MMIIPFPSNGEREIFDISVIGRRYDCHAAVIDKTVQRAGNVYADHSSVRRLPDSRPTETARIELQDRRRRYLDETLGAGSYLLLH